jgi:urea transport system substrate-binding protein
LLLTLPPALLGWWLAGGAPARQIPIRVGILHSLSGPSAARERVLVDAETLAIDDINRDGGLLGRRVERIVADGGSDPATFAKRAERLIREDKVDVLVGCATASTRRSVAAAVEAAEHLLVFPARHEGFDESAAVVSLGPLPNQHLGPALAWCRRVLSASRFFVVGADDSWSRCAAAYASAQLSAGDAMLVGDEVVPNAGADMAAVTSRIIAAEPDVVCCLLGADGAGQLLRRLREAGFGTADLPVLLLSVNEEDLRAMPRDDVTGAYVAAPCFQGALGDAERPGTRDIARSFRRAYGADRAVSEQAITAYEAIRLWAEAVRSAGTADVAAVRAAIRRQTLASLEGIVAIDPTTQHAWRNVAVGRVRPDGLVDRVWSEGAPNRPVPFPPTRSRVEWTRFFAAMERARASRRDGPGAGRDDGPPAPLPAAAAPGGPP